MLLVVDLHIVLLRHHGINVNSTIHLLWNTRVDKFLEAFLFLRQTLNPVVNKMLYKDDKLVLLATGVVNQYGNKGKKILFSFIIPFLVHLKLYWIVNDLCSPLLTILYMTILIKANYIQEAEVGGGVLLMNWTKGSVSLCLVFECLD